MTYRPKSPRPGLVNPVPQLKAARALHTLLAAWFDEGDGPAAVVDAWEPVLELANRTKTAGLIARTIGRTDADAPFVQAIKSCADAKTFRNLQNLDWTVRSVSVLRSAGIEPLVFKGALRAHNVYGMWSARSSADIDLLVREGEYDRAREALVAGGFEAQVPDASRWWHLHLGEAPYRYPSPIAPFIDLHRTIQQPGGPYPGDLEEFFTDSLTEIVGKIAIETPSPLHALLICTINYGKAVRAFEPTLAHLHEMSFATRSLGAEDLAALKELIARHRLSRLFEDFWGKSQLLFPHRSANLPWSTKHERVLLDALRFGQQPTFDRTKCLWKWTDGPLPARVIGFGVGLARVVLSNYHYRRDKMFGRLSL